MKQNIFILVFSILTLLSCDKLESVKTPHFEVTTDKEEYVVGEPVTFIFSGDPDLITIFSGDYGNDYNYRDGRQVEYTYKVKFDQQKLDGWQSDDMSILYSQDFSGFHTMEDIKSATWIDITDGFDMLKHQETRSFRVNKMLDISDLFDGEDSLSFYFAIRQIVKDQDSFGSANINRIRDFNLYSESILTPNDVLIYHNNLEWTLTSSSNKEPDRAWVYDRNRWVEMRGNVKNKRVETEDWAISKQIYLERYSDAGPDWGLAIKGLSDERVDSYAHTYTEPGVYKVKFIAANINVDGKKEIMKEVEVHIKENTLNENDYEN